MLLEGCKIHFVEGKKIEEIRIDHICIKKISRSRKRGKEIGSRRERKTRVHMRKGCCCCCCCCWAVIFLRPFTRLVSYNSRGLRYIRLMLHIRQTARQPSKQGNVCTYNTYIHKYIQGRIMHKMCVYPWCSLLFLGKSYCLGISSFEALF